MKISSLRQLILFIISPWMVESPRLWSRKGGSGKGKRGGGHYTVCGMGRTYSSSMLDISSFTLDCSWSLSNKNSNFLSYIQYKYLHGKWLRPLKWKQFLSVSKGLRPRHIFHRPTLHTLSFDQWAVLKLTMFITNPINMNIGPGRK